MITFIKTVVTSLCSGICFYSVMRCDISNAHQTRRTMFHHKEIDSLSFQESTLIMHILLDELRGLVTPIFDYI